MDPRPLRAAWAPLNGVYWTTLTRVRLQKQVTTCEPPATCNYHRLPLFTVSE